MQPFEFKAWQCPTLTWGDPTLPSALKRFTSEFGMGSGGSTSLWPPGKPVILFEHSRVSPSSIQIQVRNTTSLSQRLIKRYSTRSLGVIWLSRTGN